MVRQLSVSSNGSTWVKLVTASLNQMRIQSTFSILERIDVGETWNLGWLADVPFDFQYPRTDRRG